MAKNKENLVDEGFRDILTQTEDYVEELKQYPGIITPDCSLNSNNKITTGTRINTGFIRGSKIPLALNWR